MTYIKKLYLEGFKSFAKPTTLWFNKGISAIVGANGSGKSNLAEAICFVLGRLKVKSLRASRAANLIYNGGKKGKPAQQAKVSLVFDNTEKAFNLPFDEIELSRTVKRDGSSIYKINGETKTRQEVLELLGQAGIDPEGFNIVLQAEINNIVRLHPEEKRQIIEEVAGISIYEERKRKSLLELEKAEAKLKEVRLIMNERKSYLQSLEKEKAQAEKYERLKREIRLNKAALALKRVREKQKEVHEINEKIKQKSETLFKIKSKAEETKQVIERLEQQIEQLNQQIESSSGIEQQKLFNELSELRSQLTGLGVKFETLQDQLESLEKRSLQLEQNKNELVQEIAKLEKEKVKETTLSPDEFKFKLEQSASKLLQLSENLKKISSELVEEVSSKLEAFRALKEKHLATQDLESLTQSLQAWCKELTKINDSSVELFKTVSSLRLAKEERNIQLELKLARKELERINQILKQNREEQAKIKLFARELQNEIKNKTRELKAKEQLEKKFRATFKALLSQKEKLSKESKEKQLGLKEEQTKIQLIEQELQNLNLIKAKLDAELELAQEEAKEYQEFKELKEIKIPTTELEARIVKAQQQLEQLGSVNLRALEVYERVKQEYSAIEEKIQTLEAEKASILKVIEEIDRKKKQAFMQTFNAINKAFAENFASLSSKGHSYLELENKEDPFEGGIEIVIKLGKGKYMDADALSGGEKVIVALALIFAIQKYKPYSFYIFDEIDPALDKRNSERLAELLKRNVQQSQCIIITHNDAIIESADALYGVALQDEISKVVSLKV